MLRSGQRPGAAYSMFAECKKEIEPVRAADINDIMLSVRYQASVDVTIKMTHSALRKAIIASIIADHHRRDKPCSPAAIELEVTKLLTIHIAPKPERITKK